MEGSETQIMIRGRKNLNRAIQGDVVAVELLPRSAWLKSPAVVVLEEGKYYCMDLQGFILFMHIFYSS